MRCSTIDADGKPILRKASTHGLVHLIDPYNESEAPQALPTTQIPLSEIGVKCWQHDLWIKIIQATLDGTTDPVVLDWHPALSSPTASRYSASSPQPLAWLDSWKGKPSEQQIQPSRFLLSLMARTGVFTPSHCLEASAVDTPRVHAHGNPYRLVRFL